MRVILVVMYGCESWTGKKAEQQRIDAFELWCWRRLLRVPWTARRSNQSILKEINPEYSLEGLMLKLKLQYFGYLMRRTNSLEKTLMLGKIDVRKRRRWQRMRWLDGITTWWTWVWASFWIWWWTGKPGVLQSMGSQRVRHDLTTKPQPFPPPCKTPATWSYLRFFVSLNGTIYHVLQARIPRYYLLYLAMPHCPYSIHNSSSNYFSS